MGKGEASLHSSRTQFLTEPNDSIEYGRSGGCFVTTKKAIFFLVLAVVLLLVIICLMYYYGPKTNLNGGFDSNDIEEIIKHDESEMEESTRLPKTIIPLHYRLYIKPTLNEHDGNGNFTGSVTILVTCKTRTKQIVLNAEEITIKDVTIATSLTGFELNETSETSGQRRINYLTLKSSEYYDETRYVVNLASYMQPGNYSVRLKFSGNITESLVGLYKTSYVDEENRRKWMVTTYFEPTFARKVFPCFDEPHLKAPFALSVARRTNVTTVSNTPVKETEKMVNASGWVWDHFETTPPMSTYHLAFTTLPFKSIQSEVISGPVLKVWAPEHRINDTFYALEVAEKVIPRLEKYFGVKYPMKKIDLITVPDLASDAVATWGMVALRGTSIYLDERDGDWEDRNRIFNAITTGLAQHWFGNIVSISWWSDVWLNEGISIYITNLLKNELEPTWDSYNHFLLSVVHPALHDDSLKTTHSLVRPVDDPLQIEYVDAFVGKKAACLLRMLNSTLGADAFRDNVRSFLADNLYGTSSSERFWSDVTLSGNVSIEEFARSWTRQYGYPVVEVRRNYTDGIVEVEQRRFIEDGGDEEASWVVPVSYLSRKSGVIRQFWLKSAKVVEKDVKIGGNDSWVIFNVDQTGFYRVNYDERNWRLLQEQLEEDHTLISIANRAQLLDDSLQLSRQGSLNYSVSLNLTKYLALKERDHVPWASVVYNLNDLALILTSTCCYGIFRNYLIDLMEPLYQTLGTKDLPNETENDKLLRGITIRAMCKAQYEPCEIWAKDLFSEWMESENPDEFNPVPRRYQRVIFCTSIRTGGRQEWEFLWNRTLSPLMSAKELKTAYLTLGCTRHSWLIYRYLELSLNGNISLENVEYVWESIVHPVGLQTGFKFLRTNWERIRDNYEDVAVVMKGILEKFLSKLSSEVDLQDLTTFYKKEQKALSSVSSLIKTTVDKIKMRIKWTKDQQANVIEWLESNGYKN